MILLRQCTPGRTGLGRIRTHRDTGSAHRAARSPARWDPRTLRGKCTLSPASNQGVMCSWYLFEKGKSVSTNGIFLGILVTLQVRLQLVNTANLWTQWTYKLKEIVCFLKKLVNLVICLVCVWGGLWGFFCLFSSFWIYSWVDGKWKGPWRRWGE